MVEKLGIYIIGGAGFVGTSLIKIFNKEDTNYYCCDLTKSPIAKKNINMNVEHPDSLTCLSQAEVIINLAAVHRDDVKPITKYDDVNVQGAKNICDAARKYDIKKIIFLSSVAVFGFAHPDTNEDGDHNYFNDYGRTKHIAEGVFTEWLNEELTERSLTIIRPTVIFGEGNRGNVYNLLKQIVSGKFLMIGNGENKKSMAYVENVAAFIHHCLNLGQGLHVYNYIDKPDINMNQLVSQVRSIVFGKASVGIRLPKIFALPIGFIADCIALISRRSLPVSSIRVKKFISTTQFSSRVDKTGFIPPVTIKEGLERTIQYEFLEDNSDKKVFETE